MFKYDILVRLSVVVHIPEYNCNVSLKNVIILENYGHAKFVDVIYVIVLAHANCCPLQTEVVVQLLLPL